MEKVRIAELAGCENYPDLTFSQTVAEIVARRFDGMNAPGVHGDKNFSYRNIVLFRPHPTWRDWVQASSSPYLPC
jgi:hypothetical protein